MSNDGAPNSSPSPGVDSPAQKPLGVIDYSVLVLLVLFAGFCAAGPITNGDIWWQIAVGRWINSAHELPATDIWSAEVGEWYSFSWLYQCFVAWLEGAVSLDAVRWLHVVFIGVTSGLVFALSRRAGASTLTALGLTLALLLSFQYRIRVRPHVVNLLAFSVLSFVILRPRVTRALPVLAGLGMALWSSLHAGGAMIGAGATVILVVLILSDGKLATPVRRIALASALLVLGAWVLSPGSLNSVWVVAGDQGKTISGIGEWSSTWQALTSASLRTVHGAAVGLVWPAALISLVLATIQSRRAADTHARYPLAIAGYFLLVSFLWFRMYFLAALCLMICTLQLAKLGVALISKPRRVGLGVLVCVQFLLVFHYTTAGLFGSIDGGISARSHTVLSTTFPYAPVQLLASAGIEARVHVPPAWGGFVLYHGWPQLTVTVDGRNASSDEVTGLSAEIRARLENGVGAGDLPGLYSALPADILLMPTPCFLESEDTGEWVFFGTSGGADLYFRGGLHLEEWVPLLLDAMGDTARE